MKINFSFMYKDVHSWQPVNIDKMRQQKFNQKFCRLHYSYFLKFMKNMHFSSYYAYSQTNTDQDNAPSSCDGRNSCAISMYTVSPKRH